MVKAPRPLCYCGCGHQLSRRRPDSRFYSLACAARVGETVAGAGFDYWCQGCGAWVAPVDCPHHEGGRQHPQAAA